MWKKAITVLLVMLMVLPTVFAGGSEETASAETASDGGGDVTISMTWWGDTTRNEVYNAVIDEFEKANPGITVERPFSTWSNYFDRLSTQIAGGVAPDVMGMHQRYATEYAGRGALLDLQPYVDSGVLDLSDVPQSVIDTGRINGKLYMLAAPSRLHQYLLTELLYELKSHIRRKKGNCQVYTAPFDVLTRLTGFPLTRGMLCAMRRKPLPSPEEICRGARRIAVLENVMNPTNVGAIIRSAAALNMDGVLLSPGCSNPLYRRAVRVSMGTVFQIPWTILGDSMPEGSAGKEKTKKKHMDGWKEETWPGAGMALLKQLGFSCAAMALTDHSVGIDDEKVCAEEKLAIILGTEGEGLSRETIAACDYTVKIPMSHGVDSLNVAAASAVAFWQLGRGNEEQRKDR